MPSTFALRLRWLRRATWRLLHWHGRLLIWLMATLMLVVGLLAATLQWYVFPRLNQFRPQLASQLSQHLGREVRLAQLSGSWEAACPTLHLQGLQLLGADHRVALEVAQAQATVALWPLLLGDFRFDSLSLKQPQLYLHRDHLGVIRLAGLPLNQGPRDDRLIDWLLRQHEIRIEDASLAWQDDMRKAPLLQLQGVDFTLQNRLFDRHQASLHARPPTQLAGPLALTLSWQGQALAQWQDWQGEVELALSRVDLAAWSAWLPWPVAVASGVGELKIKAQVERQRVRQMQGQVDIHGLRVRLDPQLAWLDLPRLAGKLDWQQQADTQQLHLRQLRLSSQGGAWLANGQLDYQQHPQGGSLHLRGLSLPRLANLPQALPLPPVWQARMRNWQPSGLVDGLDLSWQGSGRQAHDWSGRARFQGLGLHTGAAQPSLTGLAGELQFSKNNGQLALRAKPLVLNWPEQFKQTLKFDGLALNASWQAMGPGWQVSLKQLSLANADLTAKAQAQWDWPGTAGGRLKLDAQIGQLQANRLANYLPTVLGSATRDWLAKALLNGEARDARIQFDGGLDKFPLAQAGGLPLTILAQLKGVNLAYLPGWPNLENLNGQLHLQGQQLTINASGKVLGTRIEQASAKIGDLSRDTQLEVSGEISGPSQEFLKYIVQSPLDGWLDGIGSSAKAAGTGRLALKLGIPLQESGKVTVQGSYRFAQNQLHIGELVPALSELGGMLQFTEHSVAAQGLQGRIMGGPIKLDMHMQGEQPLRISGQGRASMPQLSQHFALPASERLSGSTDYQFQLALPAQGWQLAVDAPMQGVGLNLPAPLGKLAGEQRRLRLAFEGDAKQQRYRFSLGEQLSGDIRRQAGAQGWQIERGQIHLGSGQPNVANRGLWLTAKLDELSLDPWLALWEKTAAQGSAASNGVSLDGLELSSQRLHVFGRSLDALALRAQPAGEGWNLSLSAKQLAGRAHWQGAGDGRLHARLSRLSLPWPLSSAPALPANQESHYPALDVEVEDFRFRQHQLGRLIIKAQPQPEYWQIEQLGIQNPDGSLQMDGRWRPDKGGGATSVKVKLAASDVGQQLARFGYPGTMHRGQGSLEGQLNWQGDPLSPDYPSMNGQLKLAMQAGQFAKIEPGVGRLLGVLSLQSLPRRMTLDFADIFSDGFAFDRIEGDSKIVQGVVSTENLALQGPAAQVSFKGEADLQRETQQMRVHIVPTVGDSVAVGAGVVLANPLLGVGAFLLQRALRDPLGHWIAYDYEVNGSWADPQVKRLGRAETAAK